MEEIVKAGEKVLLLSLCGLVIICLLGSQCRRFSLGAYVFWKD